MRRRILLAGVAAFPLAAAAAGAKAAGAKSNGYVDRHFTIELPPGYIGPVEHISGTSVSRGFRKPLPGTPLSTVILVTVQEMGLSYAKRVPAERVRLTRETLDPIMEGIASNRVGFRQSQPSEVKIAGYTGLRTAWSGTAEGIAFEGVVYCVLAGSRAIAIQIQDPAGSGKERLAEAMRVVERMKIGP